MTFLGVCLLALEQAAQIDPTDGGSGLLKTAVHSHLLTNLLRQLGGDMEGLQLSFREDRQQELGMEVFRFAARATAVRFATLAVALDERAGKHLPERAKTADQSAAGIQIRVNWHGSSTWH